jgi:hypothetical protein
MEQLLFKSASPDDENRSALAQQLKEREADLLMRATKKSAGAPLTNSAKNKQLEQHLKEFLY